MANAGRLGVGIGTGAAGGAMTGAAFGPWGAVIGGGVGAIGGALSSLLSQSDEAKQRKQAMEAYERQRAEALHRYVEGQRNKNFDEWEQRHAARVSAFTGKSLTNDPMYQATHHDTFDPTQAAFDFNQQVGDPPEFPEEATPNYGALVQSLGSLGATVGGLSRQEAAQAKLDELIQRRKNGDAQSQGMPWGGYATDDPWSMY